MVGLQCPHWAVAAPPPRDFHRPPSALVASSAFRSTDVFWPFPFPEWLGVRSSGLYWVRRTSWSGVTPSPRALQLVPLGQRKRVGGGGGLKPKSLYPAPILPFVNFIFSR